MRDRLCGIHYDREDTLNLILDMLNKMLLSFCFDLQFNSLKTSREQYLAV